MAKKCSVCGKGVTSGNLVSHSNRRTHRRYLPNLQRVKALTERGPRRVLVCTSCMKSGLITRAI